MQHKPLIISILVLFVIGLIELKAQTNNTFTDSRDGHVYKTITMGNQVWMAENLAYLPSVVGPDTDSYNTRYQYVHGYMGTSVSEAKATDNFQTYGVLYNWPAAMCACPAGWHLPTDKEWKILEMHLGMSQTQADAIEWRATNEGGKLKETGTTHWNSPNTGATNEYGFTALPGGGRSYDGNFYNIGLYGTWWSASESNAELAWYRRVYYDNNVVYRYDYDKNDAFSIRCIKD
jgi:uncharacterized protein (TIGR02145 family)